MTLRSFEIFAIALSLTFSAPATFAQTGPAAQPGHVETGQELLARLTPAQKEQFGTAGKAFDAHQYADALAGFKSLLKAASRRSGNHEVCQRGVASDRRYNFSAGAAQADREGES